MERILIVDDDLSSSHFLQRRYPKKDTRSSLAIPGERPSISLAKGRRILSSLTINCRTEMGWRYSMRSKEGTPRSPSSS